LCAKRKKIPRLVVWTEILAKDCGLLPFEKKFPERFIECGIAEQDMVSQAGGMARQGLLAGGSFFFMFSVGSAQRADLQQCFGGEQNHLRRISGGISYPRGRERLTRRCEIFPRWPPSPNSI
jgi:hypothetical protein